MADMPHVGYIDANRAYSLSELGRVLRKKPDEALIWAAKMQIAATPGIGFKDNPLDILFPGRLVILAMETQAIDLFDLIPKLKETASA